MKQLMSCFVLLLAFCMPLKASEAQLTVTPEQRHTMATIVEDYSQLHEKGGNVHALTASFFKLHLPFLYEIDNVSINTNPHIPYTVIKEEIYDIIIAQEFDEQTNNSLIEIMQLINGYIGQSDEETGAQVGELLSRVWHLAAYVEYGQIRVCESLAENILELGGCKAGVVGRLAQDYLVFLRDLAL